MSSIVLSELWRHPVKSLRGCQLDQAQLDRRGIVDDRRWMLVDSQGRFLTQRQQPRMALLNPVPDGDGLLFSTQHGDSLRVPLQAQGERLRVRIWDDDCDAVRVSDQADAWLSGFLGEAVRLVYMADDTERQVDLNYAAPGDQAAFSDGFPLLLISQASLDDLNRRIGDEPPLSMRRFRPNLVVSGCAPYAEDEWKRMHSGGDDILVLTDASGRWGCLASDNTLHVVNADR